MLSFKLLSVLSSYYSPDAASLPEKPVMHSSPGLGVIWARGQSGFLQKKSDAKQGWQGVCGGEVAATDPRGERY